MRGGASFVSAAFLALLARGLGVVGLDFGVVALGDFRRVRVAGFGVSLWGSGRFVYSLGFGLG